MKVLVHALPLKRLKKLQEPPSTALPLVNKRLVILFYFILFHHNRST